MPDAVAAIDCISLFNLYVAVTVLGEIIYFIGKPFVVFLAYVTFSSAMNMSLKYSGTVPFLYL